jgi:hypothetical protein
MKTYLYNGAADHNATIRIDGKALDIRLSKGQTVSLPVDHPHIKSLVFAGLLTEVTNTKN